MLHDPCAPTTVTFVLQDSGKIFLPRIVGHSSPETGNHFILWVSQNILGKRFQPITFTLFIFF